jgi:hypothetical protein
MYKFLLCFILFANTTFADNNKILETREAVGSSLNQLVLDIKSLFQENEKDLNNIREQNQSNKVKVEKLKQLSSEDESNPTVLDHAKKAIPYCDYSSKNLVWDGSAWKCVKMQVDTECQAAAPDEYMYKDANGNNTCAKSPKGSSINYYYTFRGYSSKCSGAYSGYEKLYDCIYKNKLGDSIQVADSYCSGKSKPKVTNKLCKINWTAGPWSACSKTCGTGTRTRSISCKAGYDCSSYPMPHNSEKCNTHKCKGEWQTGNWSACSATLCGTSGTQTRSVTCPADKVCDPNKKPKPSQTCYAKKCPIVVKQYDWRWGAWSACSATRCDTVGKQTRHVRCAEISDKSYPTVSKTFCKKPEPASQQTCYAQKCPTVTYTYNWYEGSWGKCSAECGTGTQTRTVYCKRSDGLKVADSYCKTRKPAPSQSCSNKCPVKPTYYCEGGTTLSGTTCSGMKFIGCFYDRNDSNRKYWWDTGGGHVRMYKDSGKFYFYELWDKKSNWTYGNGDWRGTYQAYRGSKKGRGADNKGTMYAICFKKPVSEPAKLKCPNGYTLSKSTGMCI